MDHKRMPLLGCCFLLTKIFFAFISIGRWENDERNGQGTYVYKNGDIYEGEWKDNKRHGSGVYTCTSTKLKVFYCY